MKVYVFPGQGSQVRGMGAGLFDELPDLTAKADQILGYSISKLCGEDAQKQLNLTQFTQPALFVVEALGYLRKVREQADDVAYFAGHSLGEYAALFAAGAFDFETGLRLVQKRAALMAEARDGGMAAVMGLSEEAVRKVLADSGLREIDIANYNSANQLVLAGPSEAIARAEAPFTQAGAKIYARLRVSGAFHSRYMEPAQRELTRSLSEFQFGALRVPVVANVTGRPYEPGQIASTLAEQLTHAVRWDLTIQFLLERGEVEFEEIGPGTTLTRLIAQIRRAESRRRAAAPRAEP